MRQCLFSNMYRYRLSVLRHPYPHEALYDKSTEALTYGTSLEGILGDTPLAENNQNCEKNSACNAVAEEPSAGDYAQMLVNGDGSNYAHANERGHDSHPSITPLVDAVPAWTRLNPAKLATCIVFTFTVLSCVIIILNVWMASSGIEVL